MSPLEILRPDAVQDAALSAALLPPDGAIAAWRVLKELTRNLDRMDAASFRLLPMVYRNLCTAGLDEGALGPLKGIYRQQWYRNRLSLAAGLEALGILRDSGIEALALKGLGLTATAYPEPALRPMHDVDILVQEGDFRRAATALFASDMRPLRGTERDFFRRARVFHAMAVTGSRGVEVDLHRFMLEECCRTGLDDDAWARKRMGAVNGSEVATLSAEDLIINTCVHGVRWDPVPAWRWVSDVVITYRSAPEVDWDYLARASAQRKVTVALAAALAFAQRYEPGLAEGANRLAAAGATRLERWDFRAQQAGPGASHQVARYLTRYARLSSGRTILRRIEDAPTYLECMWELDRPRQVPAEGLKRVAARLRRRPPSR